MFTYSIVAEMSTNTNHAIGVLPIDKPAGPTSHDIVAAVRRLLTTTYNLQPRVGHTGTLDPLATGLLLVAIGPAVRLIEYTRPWRKTYKTTITLGAASDTDDAAGHITPRTPSRPPPTAADIKQIVIKFTGTISQVPPIYSAVKVRGKKLYEYARAGLPAELAGLPEKTSAMIGERAHSVTIHHLEMINYIYPHLKLKITCSTGTYIRALARDIGELLGTGAYVQELRRTKIGTIDTTQAISLKNLTNQNVLNHLLPPETLVAHLPRLTLSAANVAQCIKGQPVGQRTSQPPSSPDQPIALFTPSGQLLGIGRYDSATRTLSPAKILSHLPFDGNVA